MSGAAVLAVAMVLDAALGEPEALWSRVPHPAVLMGRLIGGLDTRFNAGAGRRLKGAVLMAGLCLGAGSLGAVLAALPFGGLIEIAVAAILLAQKSLVQHVRAVAEALERAVPEARQAVGRIVGRDTKDMDGPAIARAAIESAAENFSDGLVAPAFWFLIGGLPGLLIYKITNTADSMIGYRTPRHEAFGWAAARLDDVLNWVPARLTAGLIALSARRWDIWPLIARDAQLHRSPNAGWPEAAMAIVLDVALSGPRSYDGQMRTFPWVWREGHRSPGRAEIAACIRVLWRVWGLLLAIVVVLALV